MRSGPKSGSEGNEGAERAVDKAVPNGDHALEVLYPAAAQIAGLEPGRRVRLRGMVGIGADGRPAMINPAYDLLG